MRLSSLDNPVSRHAGHMAAYILETPFYRFLSGDRIGLAEQTKPSYQLAVPRVVTGGRCQKAKGAQFSRALASQADLRTRQEQLLFFDLEDDLGPFSEP